jgi:hypothetical protein
MIGGPEWTVRRSNLSLTRTDCAFPYWMRRDRRLLFAAKEATS